MLPKVRQGVTQQADCWRGRSFDSVWAHGTLLRPGDTLSDRAEDKAQHRVHHRETAGRLTGQRKLRTLAGRRFTYRRSSLGRPPAASGRTSHSFGNQPGEIEVLIVTGPTTATVEANDALIRHIKRTDRAASHRPPKLRNVYRDAQCRQNSGVNIPHGRTLTTNREEPLRQERVKWSPPP